MPGSKLTVGNVEIIALDDNEASLPLSDLFPGVPAEAWAPYQQRYPESFDGTDNAHTHFRLLPGPLRGPDCAGGHGHRRQRDQSRDRRRLRRRGGWTPDG